MSLVAKTGNRVLHLNTSDQFGVGQYGRAGGLNFKNAFRAAWEQGVDLFYRDRMIAEFVESDLRCGGGELVATPEATPGEERYIIVEASWCRR